MDKAVRHQRRAVLTKQQTGCHDGDSRGPRVRDGLDSISATRPWTSELLGSESASMRPSRSASSQSRDASNRQGRRESPSLR